MDKSFHPPRAPSDLKNHHRIPKSSLSISQHDLLSWNKAGLKENQYFTEQFLNKEPQIFQTLQESDHDNSMYRSFNNDSKLNHRDSIVQKLNFGDSL